jgi:hypothetical protein
VQLTVRILPMVLFCLGVSLIIIANFIFYAILGEVNGRRGQQEQIGMLFVNVRSFEVLRLHKDLFPTSRKRTSMIVAGFLGLALGLAAFLSGFPW